MTFDCPCDFYACASACACACFCDLQAKLYPEKVDLVIDPFDPVIHCCLSQLTVSSMLSTPLTLPAASSSLTALVFAWPLCTSLTYTPSSCNVADLEQYVRCLIPIASERDIIERGAFCPFAWLQALVTDRMARRRRSRHQLLMSSTPLPCMSKLMPSQELFFG